MIKIRWTSALLLGFAAGTVRVYAQAPEPPAAYSSVEAVVLKSPEIFKTFRDGNLLVLESIDGNHRRRARLDFSAKVAYSWNPADPDDGCDQDSLHGDDHSIDPFGWSQYMMRAANEGQGSHQTGTASINGIAVQILESSGEQERVKIWHDPLTGLVWKGELLIPGEPPHVIVELKSFTLGKPAASEFAVPASCSKLPPQPAPPPVQAPPPVDPNFANAEELPREFSGNSCNVRLFVVREDTKEQVKSGFQIAIDMQSTFERTANYAIKADKNGHATFSGGHMREMTGSLRDGELSIENAPDLFDVQVQFGKGGSASAMLFRQCYTPDAGLVLLVKNPAKLADGVRWLWVKPAK